MLKDGYLFGPRVPSALEIVTTNQALERNQFDFLFECLEEFQRLTGTPAKLKFCADKSGRFIPWSLEPSEVDGYRFDDPQHAAEVIREQLPRYRPR